MFSIIANIKSKVKVEITSQIPTPAFMSAIAINYGGTADDYAYYTFTEEEFSRIENGDEYVLVWDKDVLKGVDFSIEDNKGWIRAEISSSANKVTLNAVDVQKVQVFKKGVAYSQNDYIFDADAIWKCQETLSSKDPGVDTAWSKEASAVLLTLTILLADKVTVDTSANFSTRFPVNMPNEQIADMEVEFVNGICKKIIVLNSIGNCGDWSFPPERDHLDLNGTSYRVDTIATFSGLLPY